MTRPHTIWVILRSHPIDLPPVISLLHVLLAELGCRVYLISSAPSGLARLYDRLTEYIAPRPHLGGLLGKAEQYLHFRLFVTETLKRHGKPQDLVWYASLDTALALLGSPLFGQYRYVLQLHELYDTNLNRLRLVGPIARAARHVVVPEGNRAAILQVWLKLRRRPQVVPNKPYRHPRTRRLPPSDALTGRILHRLPLSKPIVLYQGHISADRDLMPFALAMRELPDLQLWLMGRDHGFAGELTAVSQNISYVGYVPAPLHLEITSYASVGIIKYDPVSLNNLFCAPNKIWEYSGFGIPFIANDCPSLRQVAEHFNCGAIVSADRAIPEQMESLIGDLSSASSNCQLMFDATNLNEAIYNVIESTSGKI